MHFLCFGKMVFNLYITDISPHHKKHCIALISHVVLQNADAFDMIYHVAQK